MAGITNQTEINSIWESFQPQHSYDDCLPCNLLNIINDYGKRMKHISAFLDKNKLSITKNHINTICDYEEGIDCTRGGDFRGRLNDFLSAYNLMIEINEGSFSDFQKLVAVFLNNKYSYPIVGLSPEYLNDIGVNHESQNAQYQWDHIIIILGTDEQNIYFYDSFIKMMMSRGSLMERKYSISQTKFYSYWSNATFPNWIGYVKPLNETLYKDYIQMSGG